jgi:RNA polymerase sigma factor (TIGR02999 family)
VSAKRAYLESPWAEPAFGLRAKIIEQSGVIIGVMTDVTQILSQIESGDPSAAAELLPLVYDELRKLAANKLAHEKPGQTLQATALVHEAYLRLVNVDKVQHWDSRGHFFAAAAIAMQRLLVEQARRKQRLKRGGDGQRVPLENIELAYGFPSSELLALNEAISKLELESPEKARVVQLRFFVGMTHEEVGQALGISAITARRHWRYARAWLRREMQLGLDKEPGESGDPTQNRVF